MKKKLLFMLCMVVFVACMLAFSVSAIEKNGIYYDLKGTGEGAYAIVSAENRSSCTLETVVIPAAIEVDGVTYKVTEIAINAFGQVNGDVNGYLKHLVIGANVSTVGEHAFRRVKTLQTVKIENSQATSPIVFYNAQFMDCTGLLSVEAKNARIEQYGNYCFWGCSSLVTVEFPPMLKRLGQNCFRDCPSLTTGNLSNTQITEVAAWAFGSCKSLTSIKFPSTLTTIGNNVFLYCPVEMYVFPHNVNSIGGDTLAHQYKIKTLIMPEIDDTHKISTGFLHSTRPNVIIYSGDNVDFFKGQFSSLSGYDVQPFDTYVPGTTYKTNTIFYGADKTCPECNGLLGEKGFIYDNLLSEMADGQRCTYCNKQSTTKTYDPVFVNFGYSTANINGICSIVHGFKVNRASLSTYNEKLENDITEFGVLAASAVKISDTAFDVNGEAKDGVVFATIKEVNDHFDIKITNILENETVDGETAYTDAMFHLCAYVKAGNRIYYISAGYVGTSLGQAISYNTVK